MLREELKQCSFYRFLTSYIVVNKNKLLGRVYINTNEKFELRSTLNYWPQTF